MSQERPPRPQRERQTEQIKDLFARFAVLPNDERTLAQRTRQRLRAWEQMRQRNLEAIVSEALSYVTDGGYGLPDSDWLAQFLMMAGDIFSPPLRALWARILVAECSRPGSFSLKGLQRLRALTQRDAQLLRGALALRCRLGESGGLQILIGWDAPTAWWQMLGGKKADSQFNLARFGLPPSAALALEELGLLYDEEFAAGPFNPDDQIPLVIGNQRWSLKPRKMGTRFSYLRFTAIGEELSQLIPVPTHAGYLSELREHLERTFEIGAS